MPATFYPRDMLLLAGCVPSVLLGVAAPARSQQPPSEAPRFTETVDVRVVNLEAVVVDRGGSRVTGLGPEDFLLVVDGERVPIDYFSEVADGHTVRATGDATTPLASQAEADLPGRVPPVPGAEAAGTALLLFIDEEHVLKTLRNRVLEEMVERLETLGEDDRMAIVAWTGKRLVTLCPWTASRDEIADALEVARKRKAHGIRNLAERNRLATDPNGTNSGSSSRALRFERAIGGAISALRLHRGTEGRKAAMLLTSEWPNGWMQLAPERSEAVVADEDQPWAEDVPEWMLQREGFARRTIVSSIEIMKPLIDVANQLGYTLYPISAAGVQSGDNENLAARDGPDGGWFDNYAAATGGALGVVSVSAPRDSRLPEWQQLRYLAQATGGRALFADRRFDALSIAVEDTRSYYSLGFTWDFREDGHEHRIQVRTVRKDLEVRTRSSFKDPRRGADQRLDVLAALISEEPIGLAAGNHSGEGAPSDELALSPGEPRRIEGGLLQVPIRIRVPSSKVAFLPGPDGREVKLHLQLAAVDRSGAQSNIPTLYLKDEMEEPPPVLEVWVPITLRRKWHRIVASVHDPVGGEVLTATLELDP